VPFDMSNEDADNNEKVGRQKTLSISKMYGNSLLLTGFVT
jgi:hypothetical protein